MMPWRVQRNVVSQGFQDFQAGRPQNARQKLTTNALKTGEAKLKSSTLATFNKKLFAMIAGRMFEEEEDECPAIEVAPVEIPDE